MPSEFVKVVYNLCYTQDEISVSSYDDIGTDKKVIMSVQVTYLRYYKEVLWTQIRQYLDAQGFW